MKTAAWVTIMCGVLVCSCSGTETQNPSNPLKGFKDGGCKKENALASVNSTNGGIATATQALVSTDYSAETTGLKCFAWEVVSDNRLKIDLYNFEGACGADWTGKAAIESDGGLKLSLINPDCRIALCGTCMYDWSFDVEGVDTSKDVALSLSIDTCPSGDVPTPIKNANVTLPTAAKASGILCNYADFGGLAWQAMALTQCATVGMPCNNVTNGMCPSTPVSTELTCQGELICTDNGTAEQRICAKACVADGDCGSLGILSCQAGLCRPANNW